MTNKCVPEDQIPTKLNQPPSDPDPAEPCVRSEDTEWLSFAPRSCRRSAWCGILPGERPMQLDFYCVYLEGATPPFRATCMSSVGSEGYGHGFSLQEAEAEAAWDWCRRMGDGVSLGYIPGTAVSSDGHRQNATKQLVTKSK